MFDAGLVPGFSVFSQMTKILNSFLANALQMLVIPLISVKIWLNFFSQIG